MPSLTRTGLRALLRYYSKGILPCRRHLHSVSSSHLLRFLVPIERNSAAFCSQVEFSRGKAYSRTNNLHTMQLPCSQMSSLLTPELVHLADMFSRNGFELRIAGGAVRDILMGKVPHDLDLATTATPTQMKAMFESESVRMFNNNGEKHGTISVRINDSANFEITTLRIDIVTYGRRAEVKFTSDWRLDAGRRDLTVNALFLDLDGVVYDYVGGEKDIVDRRLRFVGEPDDRICEDYLRILRYFRFYGRIAPYPDQFDPEILAAICRRVDGLGGISGERLWSELRRILEGNHSCSLVLCMLECGIGPYIGLPRSPQTDHFSRVCARCCHLKPHPITLLSALLKCKEDFMNLHGRLKLSAVERDLGLFLIENRLSERTIDHTPAPATLEKDTSNDQSGNDVPLNDRDLFFYQRLEAIAYGAGYKRAHMYVCELMRSDGQPKDLLESYDEWCLPNFPITGYHLKERGVAPGKRMRLILDIFRMNWIESHFKLDFDQLIVFLPEILEKIPEEVKRKRQSSSKT